METIMAENKTAATPAVTVETTEEFVIDSKELSQAFRLLRFKIGTLQADARRKAPFLSRSQDEARAKYVAAVKTVTELAAYIDQQKSA